MVYGPTYFSLNAVPGGKVGSRKQRRANCVQKRSHGPKSRDDSFGTTLQRRCLEVLRFSLLFKHSVSACANVLARRYLAYQKKLTCWCLFFVFFFVPAIWYCLRQRREMVSCKLGRLKCSVVNMAVHEWSCLSGLSVDEFQDLLTQSGQVSKAKTFNRCVILLVGLGGPTLMKKTMKWESGVFPCHGMAELPRILFGYERGNLRSTRLALIEWLKRGQRKWFLARFLAQE